MSKNSNIIIRVDENLKNNITRIAKENGFKITDLITASLRDIERRNRIPIYLNGFLPQSSKNKKISIAMIKKCLEEAINKNGKGLVQKAYVFGSFARGDEDFKSDIDIRLVPDEGLSMFDVNNIRDELISSLNKDVDLLCVSTEKLDPDFYEIIKKEEICIYER